MGRHRLIALPFCNDSLHSTLFGTAGLHVFAASRIIAFRVHGRSLMSVEHIQVIDVNGKDWDPLFSALRKIRNDHHFFVKDYHETPAFQRVIELLTSLGCSQVLMVYPFYDEDFAYDYLNHLGRSALECGVHCVRLHFFAGGKKIHIGSLVEDLIRIGESGLIQLNDKIEKTNDHQAARYLGYLVVRPTGRECIGRTVIAVPEHDGCHIHIKARYTVNCCGVNLSVVGTPFLMQDQSTHVCAGAALWSMCYDLHRRYRTQRLYPRQITNIASQYQPRQQYRGGHTAHEVSQVLRKLGCGNDPFTVEFGLKDKATKQKLLSDLVDVIYGYLESNIPVIVGYWMPEESQGTGAIPQGGHAVLVVGHDYVDKGVTPLRTRFTEVESDITPDWSSRFIEHFVVCDDQTGPYQKLKIWETGKAGTQNREPILERAERLLIIPAISEHIYMTYRDARTEVERQFAQLESRYVEHIQKGGFSNLKAQYYELRLEMLEDRKDTLRLRLYVQQTRRFRKQLLDQVRGRTAVTADLRDIFCCLPWPKYIWVCDICGTKFDQNGRPELIGEMIFDATAPRFAHEDSLLSLRILGDLQYRTHIGAVWSRTLSAACENLEDARRLAAVNSEDY